MIYFRLLKEFIYARRKKRRPHLPTLTSSAVVNTDLNPNGSVLADGELWNAQALRGHSIASQTEVTVVAFRDHLLLVEDKP
jgi:membrane-bound ClpP family serine protease